MLLIQYMCVEVNYELERIQKEEVASNFKALFQIVCVCACGERGDWNLRRTSRR
jgi:hypothetical protein